MIFMCMCACIRACVYVFDIYSVLAYVLWFCLSSTSREELSKGTGWTSSSSSEGSGNTSTSSSLLKLTSESRLSESEEIWSPSDISESDSGIGWSISGLWFCTGCPSSSCKEIKLLIKNVCIVNETINSCNEKKLLIENFEMIRTFQVKCWS